MLCGRRRGVAQTWCCPLSSLLSCCLPSLSTRSGPRTTEAPRRKPPNAPKEVVQTLDRKPTLGSRIVNGLVRRTHISLIDYARTAIAWRRIASNSMHLGPNRRRTGRSRDSSFSTAGRAAIPENDQCALPKTRAKHSEAGFFGAPA